MLDCLFFLFIMLIRYGIKDTAMVKTVCINMLSDLLLVGTKSSMESTI